MQSSANEPADLPARPATAQAFYNSRILSGWRITARQPALAAVLRITRLVARGIVLFAFSFVEILAELLAPVVLIFGLGWAVLPGMLSMVGTEGQAHELMTTVVQAIPASFHFGHTTVTPVGLIADGLLLVAVVALCRTMQTIVSSEV